MFEGILGFCIGGALFGNLLYHKYIDKIEEREAEIKKLKYKLFTSERENEKLKVDVQIYYSSAVAAKQKLERIGGGDGTGNGIAFKSEDAKELVKFAMTQAHPDKPNGSNEKFIKYREIWDKIK